MDRAKSVLRLVMLALLLSVGISACALQPLGKQAATSASEELHVRLGYFPNLTHLVGLIGVEQGRFQEALGPSVHLSVTSFHAGPSALESLFEDEIDILYSGPNPAIVGYTKSHGEALRIIAGATSAGSLFVVRPNAKITSAADLAGKKLATPQLGNTQDIALRSYLREHGLDSVENGGTVTIVPSQNADIFEAFQQGKIDGAWLPEPWGSQLIEEGHGTLFLDEKSMWPNRSFVTSHVVVRSAFLDQHPDLVKAFLKGHVDTISYIQVNPEESKQIVNSEIERITGRAIPEAVLEQAYRNLETSYDPIASSLFQSAEDAFTLGFLGQHPPDLRGIYDLDLLNEVLIEEGFQALPQP
jgi:NitT/TauT family transport system substrate-binding protein